MGYNYTIRYKNTQAHANADALSRLPMGFDKSFIDEDTMEINFIQRQLTEQFPLTPAEIALATSNDHTLRRIRQFTLTQWPSSFSRAKIPDLVPYFNHRHSLSVINGCILKDVQVIIPTELRPRVINMLHQGHIGLVKMKQLARSHCWWPKINKDILHAVRSCTVCAQTQIVPRQSFHSWEEAKEVWSRVHVDFAGPVWNSKWLIVIDTKSKFPIVADMKNDTSATKVCNVLDEIFDWLGPPEILVSDNGPPFNSYYMQLFYKRYGINHITTAPYHPASNGLAERFVRTFKEAMIKEQASGELNKEIALRHILRSYRWTPHTTTGLAPANIMFQHSVRTHLDMMKPIKSTRPKQVPKFSTGQFVWVLQHRKNSQAKWQEATIIKHISKMLYEVKLHDGRSYKCHINQLRPNHCTNTELTQTNSLPDDLLNSKTSLTCTRDKQSSTPRYPSRIRKPPPRYSPS